MHHHPIPLTATGFPQALNLDAGDQNFRKRGFASQRVDLLSEFDAVYRRNLGLRVSAAAWYDRVHYVTFTPEAMAGESVR